MFQEMMILRFTVLCLILIFLYLLEVSDRATAAEWSMVALK